MKSFLLLSIVAVLTGCSDCYSWKYDHTLLDTTSTANIKVRVCQKNSLPTYQDVDLVPGQTLEVKWGQPKKLYNRWSMSSSCHDQHDETTFVPVVLSTASQAQFRLCTADSSNTQKIILSTETCPAGFTEEIANCPGT